MRVSVTGVVACAVGALLPFSSNAVRAETPYAKSFATYLGGSTWEHARDVVADAAGNVYVASLNSTGSALTYGTFLGGSGDDGLETHSLALDAAGNAVLAFATKSSNFPTTLGTVGTTLKGASDIAVARLNATGARVVSTMVGGTGGENPDGVYVSPDGRVFVIAESNSTDFPVTPQASQGTNGGNWDGVILVLSSDLKTVEHATYMGGTLYDNGRTGFLGADGTIYLAGGTLSTNFPATAGAFDTTFGGGSNAFAPGSGDAWLAKFTAVPEPGAATAGIGLAAVAALRRRRPVAAGRAQHR